VIEPQATDTQKFTPVVGGTAQKRHPEPGPEYKQKGDFLDDVTPVKKESKKKKKRKKDEYDDYNDYDVDYIPRRRTSVFVYLITAVITAAVFLGGAMFIFRTIFITDGENKATDVAVPDLVGKNYMEVMSNPKYEDYRIIQGETVYNSTVEEGFIIDQTPTANRMMKPDAEIYVTVSLGAKKVMMPDITNVEYRSACLELTKRNILYELHFELSEEIANGNVTRTEPSALTELDSGSKVTVYVSQGKVVKTTMVPDLKGLSEEAARKRLESFSLLIGNVIPIPSEEDPGTVISQSILPNTEVNEMTSIDISISSNVADPATPDDDPNAEGTEGEGETADSGSDTDEGDSGTSEKRKSYILKVGLSTTDEKSLVEVKAMGQVIYSEEFDSSLGKVSITLYGKGSELLSVYVNGTLKGEEVALYE
ncbi:MAG: PASTA domain-containing protein, partial [Clostridiales bacterium]|nr:PASTA domain-containing protein [Clostridiales bacterium]